jgi:hypothetical protein
MTATSALPVPCKWAERIIKKIDNVFGKIIFPKGQRKMAHITIYKPASILPSQEDYSDATEIQIKDGVLYFHVKVSPEEDKGHRYATNLPFLMSEIYGV